ncbi:ribonuclease HII [Lipingzhangella halophila]|uniref:Ribonuclease HII n=1 Tax=Lipingzhangella halophila TaxID=1783352 RepID=A0A7W7RJE6_9ACTN|nr:ribonuclease HII [Lipingzhangella halophila]MBB4933108.1 ribonuclease HII [Lipingzhangella halophila]
MTTSASSESAAVVPTYALENELAAGGAALVAGVDEVGRGAWAGPVAVCAAVTDGTDPPEGLTDSKKLTPKQRVELEARVRPWVHDHAIGYSEPAEIDSVGLTEALRRAAERALDGLRERPDAVILDGKHDYLGRPWRVRTEIQADSSCVSVAAASILAKVHRDTFMAGLDEEFPGYGLATAVGYPSPVHRATLAENGPTPHHRMSWSYLDHLPKWRHLRTPRPGSDGQLPLL